MNPAYSEFMSTLIKRTPRSDIREIFRVIEKGNIISLAGGLPDPRAFPVEEIEDISRDILAEHGAEALQYSATRGVRWFREILADYMRRRDVPVSDPDEIIVTVGSQQSIYLLALSLINPGDPIIVDSPGYLAALNVFKIVGARMIGVPLDEEGMDTAILEEKLKQLASEGKKPKLIYTVPTAQNPSGVTMSMERRKHLVELASRYDTLIVEDDPYSYFLYEPVDFKPLKYLDKEGRVIYISTVSKILAPGLRLGWTVGPKEIIGYMELTKQNLDLHTPTFCQYVAGEAIRRGVIEKNIPRLVDLYREKRDAMLRALEENFPEGSKWVRPVGGFFVFVYLPRGIDTKKMLPKAIERGVAYVPGVNFFAHEGGENTLRLNFSYPPPEKIEEGVRILGRLFKEELGSRQP